MERLTNKKDQITPKLLEDTYKKLITLKPKKSIEVKVNKNRVKIVNKNDVFEVYLNGQYITGDEDAQRTVALVKVLLSE